MDAAAAEADTVTSLVKRSGRPRLRRRGFRSVRVAAALALSGLALLGLAAACGEGGRAAAPPRPTIADPVAFLAPWICPSGALALLEESCAGARPITAADPLTLRPHDRPGRDGGPMGYLAGGGWVLPDRRIVSIYSHAPWRARRADDGGEIYVVEGDRARAAATQDAGTRGLQVFQGPECGGEGWALFWTDAPVGAWAARVARLSRAGQGAACTPLAAAYTRYRLADVDVVLSVDGAPVKRRIRTVISQHFDQATIGKSQAMEEFYFGEKIGRYRWSSYTTAPPRGASLDMRCPARPFSGVPEDARFRLNDCRDSTNLRTHDGALTGAAYGWPGG